MIINGYKIVTVMSGTSLDGIDLAYIHFEYNWGWSFEIIKAETYNYDDTWKTILKRLTHYSKSELQNIDIKYSKYLAEVINKFIISSDISEIDFVSSHGHTALHEPENGFTYQIGNRQELADELGRKVICDFRVQDVEFGGQGAPLVPIGDQLLFKEFDYCLNLGGFANISFEENKERIAYDICPVNIVLNHYVSELNLDYDDKGEIAASGKVHSELLEKLNGLRFYIENPPKSLGLEWVESNIFPLIDKFNLKIKDILRTFVEHIAIQIAKQCKKSNSKMLITGGGVYNSFLINRIKTLSSVEVVIPDETIVEFKEALIFGVLGVLKEREEVNCLRSVTGAKKDHSSGKILMPNFKNNE